MKESRQAQAGITLSVRATKLLRDHLIKEKGYYYGLMSHYINNLLIKELDK
ncbi:hypothetical protein LCGC14_1115750 [marine sediment metagenome]|uniref:Uncharacterized protein n=1 Tax=marine sediment metagenome TaxID=412755 RepID=A0A0F9M5A8_9ZZZZ